MEAIDSIVENPMRRRLDLEEEAGDSVVGENPLLVHRRLDLEEEAGDGGVIENPLLVRRRLNLNDAKIGSSTLLCFNKATLKDNLRSLAKVALDDVGIIKTHTDKSASARISL
jgi:hypothetical protein